MPFSYSAKALSGITLSHIKQTKYIFSLIYGQSCILECVSEGVWNLKQHSGDVIRNQAGIVPYCTLWYHHDLSKSIPFYLRICTL